MPHEIQTALIGFVVILLTGIGSIVGVFISSVINRQRNQDELRKSQTSFETAIIKTQAEFDSRYQTFMIERVSVLLDERKQLWAERASIADQFLNYQKEAAVSILRSEEAVKKLEFQLTAQAEKLSHFEKDIVLLTSDRDALSAKFEKILIERDNLQISYRQSQEVILKQQTAVNEMELLKNQYAMLEKRVFELEANEKALTEQVHILEISKASLEKEVSIYKADRDRLLETLADLAKKNGEKKNGGKVAAGDAENKARGAAS